MRPNNGRTGSNGVRVYLRVGLDYKSSVFHCFIRNDFINAPNISIIRLKIYTILLSQMARRLAVNIEKKMIPSSLLGDWDYLVAEMIMLLDIFFILTFVERLFERRNRRLKEILENTYKKKEENNEKK